MDNFFAIADEIGIEYIKDAILPFPERDVVLAKLNRNKFENLLPVFDGIAECRLHHESALFFSDMPISEQVKWCDEFLKNAKFPADPPISVCVLDTRVNSGHPLLQPILKPSDCHSLIPSWGTHDHDRHGTQMAGIAAYGNLADALASRTFELKHCLESGKIFAPHNDLDPIFYALATAQILQQAREAAPERTRIVCMAVSRDSDFANRGEPTSWSSELDAIAAGITGDEKQLIIISMGNVYEHRHADYPDSNMSRMAEDPEQSWNALTVGSFTDFNQPSPSIANYQVIAPKVGLSPYSATSVEWDGHKWPAKPDVVFEGGEYRQGSSRLCHRGRGNEPFNNLMEIPKQSLRAILGHQRINRHGRELRMKGDMAHLRRICGYGIPAMDRGVHCMDNNLIMVAERQIQPFFMDGKKERMNLHFYDLPWPREALQDLGAAEVILRVTLSYFIEPSPGQRGWTSKFRYALHGLRFDICGSQESEESFIRRMTNLEEGHDDAESDASGLAGRWLIGKQGRTTGSLHSDFIKATGAELSTCNKLAIYPVGGWWKERKHLGRYESETRYSLIVSLHADSQEVDLYTPEMLEIANRISQAVRIS